MSLTYCLKPPIHQAPGAAAVHIILVDMAIDPQNRPALYRFPDTLEKKSGHWYGAMRAVVRVLAIRNPF